MKPLPLFPFAPLVLAAACLPTCALAQAESPRRVVEELRLELPRDLTLLAQSAAAEAMNELATGERERLRTGSERVVKGAPYCAEAVHETVQWLPDGQGGSSNRIVRKTGTRLCRDGEGRTRQEVESGGRKLVYLADPVARENWVLDLEKKTARQLGGQGSFAWSGAWSGGVDSAAWRDYAERMREWARATAESMRPGSAGVRQLHPPTPPAAGANPAPPPAPPAPPTPPVAAVVETPASGWREARVLRFETPGDVAPPEVHWRAHQLGPRGTPVMSPLPSREIEGLRANGERSTWTIEAGRYGNERPIVITREVWTSPELMLTVMSRDFDPRSGEVNYRLQNVRRGEPDAALMKVPADFKATRRGERSERRDRPERTERS